MTVTVHKRQEVGDALCESLPFLLRDNGAVVNNCILATRLIVLASQMVGIRASALPCGVIGLSPDLAAHLDNDGPWGPEAPGWSVAIGHRTGNANVFDKTHQVRGYNGHLVAILDDTLMVDTSIGQIVRPKHDLIVKPFAAPVDRAFIRGEQKVRFDSANGTAVLYEARNDDTDYLTAPDWAETPKRDRDLVLDTLQIIKEAL